MATQALAGRCRCKSPNGGKSHQPSSWLASSVTQLDKSNFNPVRRALVLAILHCVTQGWDMDLLSQCFSILYLHQLQWWVFSLGSFQVGFGWASPGACMYGAPYSANNVTELTGDDLTQASRKLLSRHSHRPNLFINISNI